MRRVLRRGPVGQRIADLTRHAAALVDASHAQVSLLDESEQVVAVAHGIALADDDRRGPLEDSLCTVTAASGRPLVVTDARTHPWVADLPPVTSGAVGSYLGVLLRDENGLVLGSLCAFDSAPRTWTDLHLAHLTSVAELVSAELVRHADTPDTDAVGLRASLAASAAELGSFAFDLAGDGRLDWDERMAALHGFAPGTFDGTLSAFEAVVHPDDLEDVRQRLISSSAAVSELFVEYRVRLPGGAVRWIRVRGRVMPDLAGRPSHVLGAAYDASTERNLRDDLTRLMETMPAGLVRLSRDWRFTYVNTVGERVYGRTREQLLGTDVFAAFPELRGTPFEDACSTAMATGEPGMVEAYFAPLDAHFAVHVWPDEDGISLFFHDVTARKHADQALEAVSNRLAVLAEAGPRLSGSLRPHEVLEVLSELVVPQLAASIVLVVTGAVAELLGTAGGGGDPSRLHVQQVKHRDASLEAELRTIVERLDVRSSESSGAGLAVRSGRHAAYPRVPEEFMQARARDDAHLAQMRRLNTGPQLSVPLKAPTSGVLGAFTVAGTDEAPLDEVLLLDLASRAAVALENALSFARQHRAATVLQRALLPRTPPAVPDVLVATRYLPAAEQALAGGDFFKTVTVEGRLLCALGDVMGHGTASAARAGQLHGLVAALALQGCRPGELLGRLSAGIDQMMDLELATLLVCSYDPDARVLTTATAGHPPPLVAPDGGEPFYVDVAPGPPIGVTAASYAEHELALDPGATVLLFSDGLVERRAESLTVGLERLRQALGERPRAPEAVADHVLRALGAQDGGDDDIALLALNHP